MLKLALIYMLDKGLPCLFSLSCFRLGVGSPMFGVKPNQKGKDCQGPHLYLVVHSLPLQAWHVRAASRVLATMVDLGDVADARAQCAMDLMMTS
jgi:hypothetical protein